jgi:DNA-binding MarR family transcriptional regulator
MTCPVITSMSQNVNRLTSEGYAIRTPDPNDRRKVLFSITGEGTELAFAASIQRDAWLDAQLSALSLEDQNAVARACVLLTNIAGS